ncbi:acyltransferase family protein [Gordonia sp. FQ]|uniref:acyltransferase family protein n=1 Tax=Gordonia sp. FQ TaxID=3446634 RepID=UPI003F825ECB
MPRPTHHETSYLPALDGLRALAVIFVVLYHLDVPGFGGGLLGVGMFFTLSGFLITSLLIFTRERTGGLGLKTFWLRRARRLMPAVILVLAATLITAAIAVPKNFLSYLWEAISALFYVNNWYTIASSTSYFDRFGGPTPLSHMWSLSIEEQFYLVWPLLLALMFLVFKRRAVMTVVIVALALGSFWLLDALASPAFDNTRAYEGTDTRAGGLLLGAALAFWWPARKRQVNHTQRCWLDVLGLTGIGAIVYLVLTTHDNSMGLYTWGLALLTVATLGILAAAVAPDTLVATLLSLPPLRWIGERSYGIYLWHMPVVAFVPLAVRTDSPWVGAIVTLAVTVLLASLSWRFIENPIRKYGFAGALTGRRTDPDTAPAAPAADAVAADVSAPADDAGIIVLPDLARTDAAPPPRTVVEEPVDLTGVLGRTASTDETAGDVAEEPADEAAQERTPALAMIVLDHTDEPPATRHPDAGPGAEPDGSEDDAEQPDTVEPDTESDEDANAPVEESAAPDDEPGPDTETETDGADTGIRAEGSGTGDDQPQPQTAAPDVRSDSERSRERLVVVIPDTRRSRRRTMVRPIASVLGFLTLAVALLVGSSLLNPDMTVVRALSSSSDLGSLDDPTAKTPTNHPVGPTLPPAERRTRCSEVIHVGDSTSLGMNEPDMQPDPADRLEGQYKRVGARIFHPDIVGGRSSLERVNDQPNAAESIQADLARGWRGCWVMNMGINDTANMEVGGAGPADMRIDRLLRPLKDQPVLWPTIITNRLNQNPAYNNRAMQRFNKALIRACERYPNLRVYDLAGAVHQDWFLDGVHYTPEGNAERARMIATALATEFPADDLPPQGCVLRSIDTVEPPAKDQHP